MAQFTPALLEARLDGRRPTSISASSRRALRPSRRRAPTSGCRCTRTSPRSSASGAPSSGVPTRTVFQTYEWLADLAPPHRRAPRRAAGGGDRPRRARRDPDAAAAGGRAHARWRARLTWLGSELCDYNAPLLAPDFSLDVSLARFRELWDDICARLRSHPRLGFDFVDLEQMPETVGAQHNPMLHLGVTPHRNSAYLVSLADSWDKLYAKRSSATRRHDRASARSSPSTAPSASSTPPSPPRSPARSTP